MAENSKIEWTHHTFNPWRGCTKVTAGCDNCYAETMSGRNPKTLGVWGKYGTRVVASESMWREPLKWDKKAAEAGERHRVFCSSLADVFEGEETMPEASREVVKNARRRLFKLIGQTPNLDWLLLTKRPQNIFRLTYEAIDPNHEDNAWNEIGEPNGLSVFDFSELFPNVWLGTSVEDQKTADERIPKLLKIPAKVRFLSMEPLLGPVDLRAYLELYVREKGDGGKGYAGNHKVDPRIDWVIVGGESGSNARPMHPEWVWTIRDQCQAAGVPFFFKQWGEYKSGPIVANDGFAGGYHVDIPNYGRVSIDGTQRLDEKTAAFRVGKKQAGRLLDGREWNEFPEVAK